MKKQAMTKQGLATVVATVLAAVVGTAGATPMTTVFQAGGWSAEPSIWKDNVVVGGDQTYDLVRDRFMTETFVVAHAFTLDKIWVAYKDGSQAGPNRDLRVLLWEVGAASNPEPATLPKTPGGVTDLFSEPQIFNPGGANISPVSGIVVFDVENVALSAGKRYAFTLYYPIAAGIFDWQRSNNDVLGSVYVLGDKNFGGTEDRAYALQALSGSNPGRMATTFQAAGWSGEPQIVVSNVLVGSAGGDRNVRTGLFDTHTFVGSNDFALDRIWVAYKDAASGHTQNLRVLLWEVGPATDPEPANLPATVGAVTDLFSEPQLFNMNGGAISPSTGYAIFDVENIDLEADKRYAFTLDYANSNAIFIWPNSNNLPTGSYYVTGIQNFGGQYDRPFAIQAEPPPDPPSGTVILLR